MTQLILLTFELALDERGRLLVAEDDRADTLRVVEASLAPPAWMEAVAEVAPDEARTLSLSLSAQDIPSSEE